MRRKRVLIFWGGEGYGHLVAARAVEQQLHAIDPNIEVILKDTLDFPTKLNRKLITGSYFLLTQYLPKVFDHVYEYAMKTAETAKSIADPGMAKQCRPERMLEYIQQIKPDCVLVTFSPAAEMIIYLRDRGYLLDLPVGHVLIDYVSNKYFCRLGERLEMTFAPHPSFVTDFIRWELPAEKICASGVPIFTQSLQPFSNAERKAFLASQSLDSKKPILVLVSGAAGVGNFSLIIKSLARELSVPTQLVVICGRNKRNYRNVEKLRSELPSNLTVILHGLLPTELALNFVKVSDLVITKSGALTPTEINYIGKPAVYLDINGGQERHNSAFIVKYGLGKMTKDQSRVGELVGELMNNPSEMNAICEAQKKFRNSIQQNLISDWVIEAIPR